MKRYQIKKGRTSRTQAATTMPIMAPIESLLPPRLGLKSTGGNVFLHFPRKLMKRKHGNKSKYSLGVTEIAEIRGPYTALYGMELVPFPVH